VKREQMNKHKLLYVKKQPKEEKNGKINFRTAISSLAKEEQIYLQKLKSI